MTVADIEELARWRGNVEARMHAFEGSVAELKTDLREIRASTSKNGEMLALLLRKNGGGESAATSPVGGGTHGAMTFRWVLEKVALPLLLAINAVILSLIVSHILQ